MATSIIREFSHYSNKANFLGLYMLKRLVEDLSFKVINFFQKGKLPIFNEEVNLIATGDSFEDFIESIDGINIGCNWLLKKYDGRVKCRYYLLSDPAFFSDDNIDYVIDVINEVDMTFIPFQSFLKRRELWRLKDKLYLLNFNSTNVNVEREFTCSLDSRIHCANTVVLEFGIPVSYAITTSFINVYGFDLKYNKETDDASEEWRINWTREVLTSFSLIPEGLLERFRFKGYFEPGDVQKYHL